MTTKNRIALAILALTQPRWTRPARMMLVILATASAVAGCPSKHPH